MTLRALAKDRTVFSWALYDWANSAFATTVIAGFFPIFFKQYWSAGSDPIESTAQLGFANSLSSAFILVAAPLFGALADSRARRKRYLGACTALGVCLTAALWFVPQGAWSAAAICYALAVVGFSGGIVFYDSLIVAVSPPGRVDEVSAIGFSFGYIGGGTLFALNVAMTLAPGWFGLADAAEAVRLSFLTVAVWWLAFSIPLLRHVPEPPPARPDAPTGYGAGFAAIAATWRAFRTRGAHRAAVLFLLAYFFYIDGVHTIIRMAVDYGLALGLPAESLIVALLITQCVGFPAALAFGAAARRFGPRPVLCIGIAVYIAVTGYAFFLSSALEFYVLAAVIGLVQGGVQSVSRSLYARFVPTEKSGEFFGYFNMFGRFAAVIGPLLVALTNLATGSSRLGILSVAVVLVIGLILLTRVRQSA